MIGLINKARMEQAVAPVTLGNNTASQEHAEAMLEGNFTGHWGLDGLNPNMRYTLAGGTGYVAENTGGYVLAEGVNYRKRDRLELLIELHESLINSPDHWKNIIDKWHTTVNLGIACHDTACSIVQNFEGNYIVFSDEPSISDGNLSLSGELKENFTLHSIQVWYDQPPHPLTLGQIDATYSYLVGQEPVTFLLQPAPPGYYWSPSNLLPSPFTWTAGPDPYNVDPNKPRRVRSISGIAIPFAYPVIRRTLLVPWTVAETWQLSESAFEIKADLSAIIDEHKFGVYTIIIFGDHSGEIIPLTNYSVFVEP